ncbi:MAG: efflux RND transporter permease subunit, partial [Stagnimonas sp.]|nr:efflux RND transporter permease subunit [Stagnimonas sp.]
MIEKLLQLAIARRGLVMVFALALAALGAYSYTRLPIDAVPDITNVQVIVNVPAPGYTPLEAEQRVSFPMETAMSGLPRLSYTRSLARYGLAQVTVVFEDGTDIYFARQQVAERLAAASEGLPEGVEPGLSPITTGLGEVLMWTVDYVPFTTETLARPGQPGWQAGGVYLTPEGERLTTPEQRATYLRTVQDWIIAPQMRTTSGLAGVDTVGGYVKEYAVRPNASQLAAYGLGLADLVEAVERANTQAGAGYIQRAGEALVVRTDALALTIDDLAQAPVVNRGGLVVRVADVATVEIGQAPRLGGASRDGHEAVLGTALMIAGGNSRTVAQAAAERLAEVDDSLPPGIVALPVLNRSELVNSTISTVARNLTEGALLVV